MKPNEIKLESIKQLSKDIIENEDGRLLNFHLQYLPDFFQDLLISYGYNGDIAYSAFKNNAKHLLNELIALKTQFETENLQGCKDQIAKVHTAYLRLIVPSHWLRHFNLNCWIEGEFDSESNQFVFQHPTVLGSIKPEYYHRIEIRLKNHTTRRGYVDDFSWTIPATHISENAITAWRPADAGVIFY